MDVFAVDIPPHLEDDFVGLMAYMTQLEERNVSIDIMKSAFEDRIKCITICLERSNLLITNTESLIRTFEVVLNESTWRLIFASEAATCRPVGLMHFQKLIDRYIDGKPTLVLTRDVIPFPNGVYNLGLCRAVDNLNIVDAATGFTAKPGITGGGGHPFAGGVQSAELLVRETIIEMAIEVMRTIFCSSFG